MGPLQMHDGTLALQALIDKEIPVMEDGSQIVYRWGWAEVLMVSDETPPCSMSEYD